jgi:hypothetical protein
MPAQMKPGLNWQSRRSADMKFSIYYFGAYTILLPVIPLKKKIELTIVSSTHRSKNLNALALPKSKGWKQQNQ